MILVVSEDLKALDFDMTLDEFETMMDTGVLDKPLRSVFRHGNPEVPAITVCELDDTVARKAVNEERKASLVRNDGLIVPKAAKPKLYFPGDNDASD